MLLVLEALAAPDACFAEGAVRRPEPEVAPPLLPGALDWGEAELAVFDPDAEDPPAAGCALRDAEEFAPAEPEAGVSEPEAGVPGPEAAGAVELAEFDAPLDAGAEGACPAGAGIEGSVSMRSAATGAGPAGPQLQ
ncbi:MAG: hypothetical protein WBE91_10115 [Steroidobacteraceae bacterium]